MLATQADNLQKALRQECIHVVGADFIKHLHRKSARNFLPTVAHVWFSIVAAIALAIAVWHTEPILLAVCWLPLAAFIATRINALNVQVHEGSHGLLAESRSTNDRLCNWLAAYPTLYDVDQYGAVHLHHHQHLNEPGDPELSYYQLPSSRAGLLGCFLQDFFWITLVRRLFTIRRALATSDKASVGKMSGHVFGRVACQIILLGALHTALDWPHAVLFYLLFWLVPLFSIYPMLIRLRQVAEHYAPEQRAPDSHTFVARTTQTGWLEHYLLGAQMEYHFEHHLFPLIPYANLARLHARLLGAGFFRSSRHARPDHSLSQGYLHFWRHVVLANYAAGSGAAR